MCAKMVSREIVITTADWGWCVSRDRNGRIVNLHLSGSETFVNPFNLLFQALAAATPHHAQFGAAGAAFPGVRQC